jgi:hypothetical protein
MFSIRQNFTQRSTRLPKKSQLLTMDIVSQAQPFVNVISKNTNTLGLDIISQAQPFVGAFNNRLTGPIITVTSNHPDVDSWLNTVSLNGGTVSNNTISALNTFCNSIDNAVIRNKFYRLNLFCGNNLQACLIPLYVGPTPYPIGTNQQPYGFWNDINFGFVYSDYNESGMNGGLQGNGIKYLLTGMKGTALSAGNRHLSVYEIVNATTDYSPSVAAAESNSIQHAIGPWTNSTNYFYRTHNGVGSQPNTIKNTGFWVGSDIDTASARLYRNGSTITTSSGQSIGGSTTLQYTIFGAININNVLSEGSEVRLGAYSIGLSLNDPQVLAFYNAMQAFQTSLTRNV